MSQILLYVFLAGVAIFLFAMTRPKSKPDASVHDQAEWIDLLQKFQYEQKALSTVVQQTLRNLEDRISLLESSIQERDVEPQMDLQKASVKHVDIQTKELESPFPLSPRHKEVVTLLQQGKEITSVAKQTGVGVGEVQLLERLLHKQEGEHR